MALGFTAQGLFLFTRFAVIEGSINEEPVAGKPRGGFCEGRDSPREAN
jgi:hypothetical protein